MEMKQNQIFNFSHTTGGTTYNFSIQAESRDEACKKLMDGLGECLSELGKISKAGTKAS